MQANIGLLDGDGQLGEDGRPVGPPTATLTRRSQSYSDFHDAAQAVLGPHIGKPRRRSDIVDTNTEIRNELDFVDWYNDLEHDLLDASHDDFTLVPVLGVQKVTVVVHWTYSCFAVPTTSNWNYRNRI